MSKTEAIWKERVARWRTSGETAEAFSAGRGWSPKTLRWWSSRLGRDAAPPVVRMAQLIRPAASGERAGVIVVELLEVRVRVTIDPGADRETVATILELLAVRGRDDSPRRRDLRRARSDRPALLCRVRHYAELAAMEVLAPRRIVEHDSA